MFAYINGKLDSTYENYIIVDVHGVGFKIFTSQASIKSLGENGSTVKMYTYTHVREDIMDLYGFTTKEELSTFELLISVSGVGPKSALSVLSVIEPEKFAFAIVTGDVKTITLANGIGKKAAERIILELKDKIKTQQLVEKSIDEPIDNTDALDALLVLGFTSHEAEKVIKAVYKSGMDTQEIIREALKYNR